MTAALLDAPRGLNVETTYVGSPTEPASFGKRLSAWTEAEAWGGTQAFRRRAVGECLDTAAILRDYREPLEGETWLIPGSSERRLLAQVNAIIGLGPSALEQVTALSLDPDVPDPGRVFASLLVLGCVDGRRWLAPIRDIFMAATKRNPDEAAAAVEALSLCPHPELRTVIVPLLGDDRPSVRSGAVRMLAYRNELSEAAWYHAIQDQDPAVVAAAARAPLADYDRGLCNRTLESLFSRTGTEAAIRPALRAGLSLRLGAAHEHALHITRTDPSWAGALNCLAMFGCLADAQCIRELLVGPYRQDAVRAAATLGSIDLVPDLLDLLHRDDAIEDGGMGAGQALAAITGFAFDETTKASQARELWLQHAARFEKDIRYRGGQPLTTTSLLQALLTGPGSREARQNIYLEMLAATQSRVPRFSPFDFVGVQIKSLKRIEHWLESPRSRIPSEMKAH